MANNTQYNCVAGQSFTDVCLNTYGSLDYYIKMLNDNNVQPDDVPYTGQVIMYDNTLINNQSVTTTIRNNNIIYATFTGYGIPEQPDTTMTTYNAIQPQISYTATSDSETVITFTQLQSAGAVLVSVTKEIHPLKTSQFNVNYTTGAVTLLGGSTLKQGETLYIIYSINQQTT